jgi:hypothetical protein
MNAVEFLSQSGDFELLVAEVGDELEGASSRSARRMTLAWMIFTLPADGVGRTLR